jgi:putative nucleotidyltransferase with HDIG domain
MQVANLCAEVAAKIGANVQLVRTAALYHDIGKLQNPAFFTENQNAFNPHDGLPEEQSAQIIIRHVADGLEMADKHRLPSVIKECIATHHGRSKAKYFYVNYVNKHPDEPVNEEIFTYPGPNPHTKEQAILMMADSTEAASRSLPENTEDSIRQLVNRIIDQQVTEGYFDNCPITFQDIATAKDVLVSSLKTIYHARISYPTLEQAAPPKPEVQSEVANARPVEGKEKA